MSVEDFARKGSLGTLTFTSCGWFLVRAMIACRRRTQSRHSGVRFCCLWCQCVVL